MIEPSRPIDHRLEDDRAEHLPPRGAQRPQRGELPHPLRDRDRERVGDDEAADEERDAGEAEQGVLDDVQPVLGLAAVGGRLRGGRLHLRRLRQERGDLRGSSSASDTPGLAPTRITSSLPSLSNRLCAVARSKTVIVVLPIEPTEPKRTMPLIRYFATGPSPNAPTVWPTVKCCLSAVDLSIGDLPVAPGPLPGHELERVEALVAADAGDAERDALVRACRSHRRPSRRAASCPRSSPARRARPAGPGPRSSTSAENAGASSLAVARSDRQPSS